MTGNRAACESQPCLPRLVELTSRDSLPGPPLSKDTTIGVLLKHNVSVAIGIDPMPRGPLQSFARNARLDAAWVCALL